jgi:hypothetical protein
MFSKVAAVAAVVLALVAAPAPASAAVAAYRVDFWAYFAYNTLDQYGDNVTAAFVSDLASVFNTSESAITIKDAILLPDTDQNVSVVFTVEGGNDAPFLASPLEAQAPWTTAVNQLLYAFFLTVAKRQAAVAVDDSRYYSAYITNVSRLGSPDVLPNPRYLDLTLHGKHLATATADGDWPWALAADIGTAFGIRNYVSTHLTLISSVSSGVNNSTLSVRFSVKPMLDDKVNRTMVAVFIAANGTVSWLPKCQDLHTNAASQDLGIVLGRAGSALDVMPESEYQLTVTGTGYAPGDESYTAPTNAPGDAASGVTTAAVFIAATAFLSAVSLF